MTLANVCQVGIIIVGIGHSRFVLLGNLDFVVDSKTEVLAFATRGALVWRNEFSSEV